TGEPKAECRAPRDDEVERAQAPGVTPPVTANEGNPLPPAKESPSLAAPDTTNAAGPFMLPPDRLLTGPQAVGLTVDVQAPPGVGRQGADGREAALAQGGADRLARQGAQGAPGPVPYHHLQSRNRPSARRGRPGQAQPGPAARAGVADRAGPPGTGSRRECHA